MSSKRRNREQVGSMEMQIHEHKLGDIVYLLFCTVNLKILYFIAHSSPRRRYVALYITNLN